MNELRKYTASELATLDDALFAQGQEFAVYLAADVERMFVPILKDYCRTTQILLASTTAESPSKGPALAALEDAQRLLASLIGQP